MKALKLTLIFMVCALAANAQLGIQAGWNVNNYQFKVNGMQHDRVATSGFNAGLFYRGWMGHHGVIEPSLLFSRKGALNNEPEFLVDQSRARLDYVQASLPFMYRGRIDRNMDFTIGGGPFAAVLADADVITQYANGTRVVEDYRIGNGAGNDFKPFDAGLRFQTGLRISRVNLSMAYDLGLADIAPQHNAEIRTRAFSLNLGLFLW
jgi:hypothetical protein